nr:CPBP family intramembrane glutamic endopeptidase [Microbacterium ulmi]
MLRLVDLVVLAAPLVLAALVAWRVAANPEGRAGGIRRWAPVDIVLGVCVGGVVRAIVELVQPTTGTLEGPLTAGPAPGRIAAAVVLVAGVAAVSPVVEEVFFRGVLQQALTDHLGGLGRVAAASTAIVVSTAAFVALHVLPGGAVVPVGLVVGSAGVGVGAGILLAVTGRLSGAIVTHVVFNGSGILLLMV